MQDENLLTLKGKAMKILLIGFSESGKTYFLGSLPSLKKNTGESESLYVRDKTPNITNGIHDYYDTINGTKEGAIPTTTGHRNIDLVFQHGVVERFNITITDIEGQSVESKKEGEESKIEKGEQLYKRIEAGEFHGVFILMKSPETEINDGGPDTKFKLYETQLSRMVDFIIPLIRYNLRMPIALLFTQIDELYEMTGIIDEVKRLANIEFAKKNTSDLSEKHKIEKLDEIKSEVLNDKISELVKPKTPINLLTESFISQTGRPSVIENLTVSKPFLCSVLGFDNSKDNPADKADEKTKIAKQTISPYGVKAAFLWMIFKIVQLNKNNRTLFKPYWPDEFNETTIKDEIHVLYTNGECFSDRKSELGEIWGDKNL
jgi:hypothetical protein